MTDTVRASLAWAIVLVVPGALIASLIRFNFRTLATWAAVPAFSFGGVFLLAEFTNITRLPFGVPAFFGLVAVLAGVLIVRRSTRRRRVADAASASVVGAKQRRLEPFRGGRLAYALLAAGIAISAMIWLSGLQGTPKVPPGADAEHHGFMVARIMATHSVDVSKVAVSDPQGQHKAVNYYPLTMHASAALATRLSGVPVGRVLIVMSVLFASVVLPLGMFVLARMLAPSWPLVAGFTAFIVPTVKIFPYSPVLGAGLLGALVGMTLVPITAVLFARAIIASDGDPPAVSRKSVFASIPAALALLTAISLHSSQLPVIVGLAALLVLEYGLRRQSPQLALGAFVRAAWVFGLTLIMFAPTLVQFGAGVSERTPFEATKLKTVSAAIGPILTLEAQEALAGLAFIGAAIWLYRQRPAWVVGYATVIAVTLLASVSKGPLARALSLPWYRNPNRIEWNQAFFVSFFIAVLLASAVLVVVRAVRVRSPWSVIPATAVVLAVFVGLAGLDAYRTNRANIRHKFFPGATSNQMVSAASEAAFTWLRHHARSDDTVVNNINRDGSMWMYAEAQVTPLFGYYPYRTQVSADWRHRLRLLSTMQLVGQDRRVDKLVRRYHARWVYLDEHTLPGTRPVLTLGSVRQNTHISEVFQRGSVHIFRIDVE